MIIIRIGLFVSGLILLAGYFYLTHDSGKIKRFRLASPSRILQPAEIAGFLLASNGEAA